MITYCLMLAVNDPANGVATEHIDAVQLYMRDNPVEPLLSLQGRPVHYHSYTSAQGHKIRTLVIGHLHCRVLGYATWVGNWCWDMAQINAADAARILHYLRRRGWTCEGGATALFDRYMDGREITVADLQHAA